VALKKRTKRRIAGVLNARLPELELGELPDPRARRGRRWELPTLLRVVIVGIMAGCASLLEVEALTDDVSLAVRKLLGLSRRTPDTTLRDTLVRLQPPDLRRTLRKQIRTAYRRKALTPFGLPFGQVAIDGKATHIDASSGWHVQLQEGKEGGLLRTTTCTLVSARARPCIEAVPIPSATNEMGYFDVVMRALHRAYGRTNLFELVSSDAGGCSLENASLIRELGYHYLFALNNAQPTLYGEATMLLEELEPEEADAETRDLVGRHEVIRRVFLTEELAGYLDWTHLRTIARVDRIVVDHKSGEVLSQNSRYFLSSLPRTRLTDSQWLYAVRAHWGVENNSHQQWDYLLKEDERPWITKDAKGTLAVMILRRIAHNMLTLFRAARKSEELREVPWKTLLRQVYNTLIATLASDLEGLRARIPAVVIG